MRHSDKYNISKLFCALTLLIGSMLFTGHTGSSNAKLYPGSPTELLHGSNSTIKNNTAAYHCNGTIDEYENVPVYHTQAHTCFLFHQNRLAAIRFKTAVFLAKQFAIHTLSIRQKTVPFSSPEHFSIS